MVGLIGDWASTAFRLSMPFRDVSVAACLGMNRLGKYSFARHRQEVRPGSARGLVAQAAAIAVRIRAGRDLEPSSSSLPRDGVDRALADAEIRGDVLAGVSDKHKSKIWR
jgi:hypothetical protein